VRFSPATRCPSSRGPSNSINSATYHWAAQFQNVAAQAVPCLAPRCHRVRVGFILLTRGVLHRREARLGQTSWFIHGSLIHYGACERQAKTVGRPGFSTLRPRRAANCDCRAWCSIILTGCRTRTHNATKRSRVRNDCLSASMCSGHSAVRSAHDRAGNASRAPVPPRAG
jgi:hypothetical protein